MKTVFDVFFLTVMVRAPFLVFKRRFATASSAHRFARCSGLAACQPIAVIEIAEAAQVANIRVFIFSPTLPKPEGFRTKAPRVPEFLAFRPGKKDGLHRQDPKIRQWVYAAVWHSSWLSV